MIGQAPARRLHWRAVGQAASAAEDGGRPCDKAWESFNAGDGSYLEKIVYGGVEDEIHRLTVT